MNNLEFYKDEIKQCIENHEDEDLRTKAISKGFEEFFNKRLDDTSFEYVKNGIENNKLFVDWLLEERKEPVKLTKEQYYFLKLVDEEYSWIAKDKNGDVSIYDVKPKKSRIFWNTSYEKKHLKLYGIKEETFSFLSWEDEEPTNIQELLKNCEVEE